MAVQFNMSGELNVAADALVEKLTDAKENETMSRETGALQVEAKRTDLGDNKVKLEIELEEPSRQGSGTEKSTLILNWDLSTRRCVWDRKDHTYGDMVRVEGEMWVESTGDASCTLSEKGEVDIKIPIIGKKFAKKVASSLETKHPEKRAYWEKRVKGE